MNIFLLSRTLVAYLLICIAGMMFIPPCLLIACLPARFRYDNPVFFFLLDCFYKAVMFCSLSRVVIKGKKNLPDGPAIFIANHQSALDIPVVGSLCYGYSHVWLVLAYYINTPVLGFFIKRMFVPVDREVSSKAARSLIQIYRFVQGKDRHLIIFPEGGRFNDGTVHSFFEGFAMIAKRTQRPVIPVFMPYNGAIYPPYSFYVYPYPLVTIIGEPYTYQESETDAEFTSRIYEWFEKQNEKYNAVKKSTTAP